MKRALFLIEYPPHPPHTGARYYAWHVLEALRSLGVECMLVTFNGEWSETAQRFFSERGIEWRSFNTLAGGPMQLPRHIRLLTRYCSRLGFNKISGQIWKLRRPLSELPGPFDFFITNMWYSASYFGRYLTDCIPHRKSIILIHDLHYLYNRRLKVRQKTPFLRRLLDVSSYDAVYRRNELNTFSRFDTVVTISEHDRTIVRQALPGIDVRAWPVVAPARPAVSGPQKLRDDVDLLFVGSAANTSNLIGWQWFMQQVWPLLGRRGRFRVHIAGGMGPQWAETADTIPESVTIHGFVSDNDLDMLYRSARVVILPLPIGTGVKIKLIEALSYGAAIVTTAVGNEGVGLTHGQQAYIADEPDAFADACRTILSNTALRQALKQAAAAFHRLHASPAALTERVAAALSAGPGRITLPPRRTATAAEAAHGPEGDTPV